MPLIGGYSGKLGAPVGSFKTSGTGAPSRPSGASPLGTAGTKLSSASSRSVARPDGSSPLGKAGTVTSSKKGSSK